MRSMIIAAAALVCSVLWLGLLVMTHFNSVAVSVGLLVALYATGSSATTRPKPARTHRTH